MRVINQEYKPLTEVKALYDEIYGSESKEIQEPEAVAAE